MMNNKMVKKTDVISLWDRDLSSILNEVGKLSGKRQFTAYFVLLYRILFETEMPEKDRVQAVEVVLAHLDGHVARNSQAMDWGDIIPEPLMVLVMAGIMKLGMDIEPLTARGSAKHDFGLNLSSIDLKDNITADIAIDLFDQMEGSVELKVIALHDMLIAFYKGWNSSMALLMLDKFQEALPMLKRKRDATEYMGSFISELYDIGWIEIADKLLADFLPPIEAAAFWNTLTLLKLAISLKKIKPALAERLLGSAKEEIGDVAGFAAEEEVFKDEFGASKEYFLSEAARALAEAGELAMALEMARKMEHGVSPRSNALSGIAMVLLENGMKEQVDAIIEEALEAAHSCEEQVEKDLAFQSLAPLLMRMGKADAAIKALDSIKEPWVKCYVTNWVGMDFFKRNDWEKGEEFFENAILLAERSRTKTDITMELRSISQGLALYGYDDWALRVIRSIKGIDLGAIKGAATAILGKAGALKAVEFLEKAYDIPFFSQPAPAAGSMDRMN